MAKNQGRHIKAIDSHDSHGGGVDINKILEAAKKSPKSHPQVEQTEGKTRRKKKQAKGKNIAILSHDNAAVGLKNGNESPNSNNVQKNEHGGNSKETEPNPRRGNSAINRNEGGTKSKNAQSSDESKVVNDNKKNGIEHSRKNNKGKQENKHSRKETGPNQSDPKSTHNKNRDEDGAKSNELHSKDENKVVVLSHDKKAQPKKNGKKGSAKNVQAKRQNDHPEVALLKQQLFEAKRDLEKERNTREMLENRVKSLSLELRNIKEKLGEDKHYCISSLKEELEFEQKLRVSVQNELLKSNDMLITEQKQTKSLEKHLESEKDAMEAIKSELQLAKKQLETERGLQNPVKAELDLERRRNKDFQKRLQCEAASSIAIRMELQSIKDKSDRVKELEEELRQEKYATNQRNLEVAASAAMRMELKAANEKLRKEREKAAAKESYTMAEELSKSLLSSKYKDADTGKDRLVRRLRRELHETRAKLKNERRKGEPPVARSQKKSPKRTMSAWVDVAPTNSAQHAGLIPILQSPPSMNMPRPVETSLPGSSSTETPASHNASAPPSLFHFDEDDASVDCDKALEPLHDELTFITNAYDPDEVVIEGNKVTHLIELTTWFNSDTILLALTVEIPNNYPASGVLSVKASIKDSSCSHALRKCAVDALAELEEICTWEAKANEGKEAIHPIFSVASGWAHTDWHNTLSKELSISEDTEKEPEDSLSEICVSLIHTHHIIEADKIQSIKKNASKLSLGGFVKIGKPGLILVEGNDTDCDHFLEALVQNKKVFHSSTFKRGGKALRKVSDIVSCRCLPRKMEQMESKVGMDEIQRVCDELGLLQALNDIISL
mmetsp:Transcript_44440/g.93291  ORF Transcript_44440/g.93291 Transcript_44440/m.93291 type:complete len:840 (+) Transcript_44440:153-2672(+)